MQFILGKRGVRTVIPGAVLARKVYLLRPLSIQKDCNKLALDYLEYAKSNYQAHENDEAWQTAVDTETIIHNLCNLNPKNREELEKYIGGLKKDKN